MSYSQIGINIYFMLILVKHPAYLRGNPDTSGLNPH
jgi:hypothetical protein